MTSKSQRRFAIALAIVQVAFAALYGVLLRYGESADPLRYANGSGAGEETWKTLSEQYPCEDYMCIHCIGRGRSIVNVCFSS